MYKESFNAEVARGDRKEDQQEVSIVKKFHNFIRVFMSLPDWNTKSFPPVLFIAKKAACFTEEAVETKKSALPNENWIEPFKSQQICIGSKLDSIWRTVSLK